MLKTLDEILEKYKSIFAILVVATPYLFIAIGFGFITPKAQFDDLKAEQVALRHQIQVSTDSISNLSRRGVDSVWKVLADRIVRDQKVDRYLRTLTLDICIRRRTDHFLYNELECDAITGTR